MNRQGRRSFLTAVAGGLGSAFWADRDLEAYQQNIRTTSKPSELRITDLRIAWVAKQPTNCPIIRIDTNQGISGYGQVRDNASKNYALVLKSRILGENPCNIDNIFRKIKQFGFHARQGGGVSGIEVALWDLAGKAYNVPIYQMLGGSFRDRIRCYADTDTSKDPKEFADRLKMRKDKGYTWLKMDLGIRLLEGIPGTVTRPLGQTDLSVAQVEHMFTGAEITQKGIDILCNYVATAREAVGMDIPLSADHFGHIGVNSCIRLGKALEKYNLAWLEDMIPWQHTQLLKKITDAVDIPLITGEDIYLKEGFVELGRNHAVDIIHPDVLTTGGILETKKIGDACQEYGLPMAIHMAETPIAALTAVHVAAATENFLVLENHRIIANVYYVGTSGYASYLVTSDQGHILIDTGYASFVPMIRKNVEQLGFRFQDIKILLVTHAHRDHSGGAFRVKELTGAQLMVMDQDAKAVETGGIDMRPVKVDRVLHDKDEVRLGGVKVVAYRTPGHTPGNTTFVWKASQSGNAYTVVLPGSLSSNASTLAAPPTPTLVEDYRSSIRFLKTLPCDVYIGAHGKFFDLQEKYAQLNKGGANPYIDPNGYHAHIKLMEQSFYYKLDAAQRRSAH